MQQQRKYSDEFKREAVSLASQSNVSLKQIAEELGIGAGMLGRWRREQSQHGDKAFMGHVTSDGYHKMAGSIEPESQTTTEFKAATDTSGITFWDNNKLITRISERSIGASEVWLVTQTVDRVATSSGLVYMWYRL